MFLTLCIYIQVPLKCFAESRSATLMTSSTRPLPSTRPAFPPKVILCKKEHKSRLLSCHDNSKLQGESWLGLENLYYVTTVNKINGNGGSYSLKVTMTDYDGAQYTAVYDKFEVRQINNMECSKSKMLCIFYDTRQERRGAITSFPFPTKE